MAAALNHMAIKVANHYTHARIMLIDISILLKSGKQYQEHRGCLATNIATTIAAAHWMVFFNNIKKVENVHT